MTYRRLNHGDLQRHPLFPLDDGRRLQPVLGPGAAGVRVRACLPDSSVPMPDHQAGVVYIASSPFAAVCPCSVRWKMGRPGDIARLMRYEGLVINSWYLAAILLGAVAAFCAYYGSMVEGRRSSEEQSSRLESKLQTLGTQIQELRLEADSPDKVARLQEVDERYRALAEEFFRSVPLRTAQEEARTAQQQVEELQRTQEIEAFFRAIKREAEKLASAYNRSAGQVVLEIEGNGVPENLFHPTRDHPAYVLLKFQGPKFWAMRIVTYPDRTLALQFLGGLSPDGSSNYDATDQRLDKHCYSQGPVRSIVEPIHL